MRSERFRSAWLIPSVVAVTLAGSTGCPRPSSAEPPHPEQPLVFGRTLRHEITRDAPVRLYSVELEPGDYLRIDVDQMGIDVETSVLTGDQREAVLKVDTETGSWSRESLEFVAQRAGVHWISVFTHEAESKGSFELTAERHRATPSERRHVQASSAYYAGEQARWNRDAVTAERFYRSALETWTDAPEHTRWRAMALRRLGIALSMQSRFGEAYARFHDAYQLLSTLGPSRDLANVHNDIGTLLFEQRVDAELDDATDRSVVWFERVLDLDFPLARGTALFNLGQVHYLDGNHRLADRHFREATEQLTGYCLQRASAFEAWAALSTWSGHPESAIDRLETARELRSGKGCGSLAGTLTQLGWAHAHWEHGDLATAEAYLREAAEQYRSWNGRAYAGAMDRLGSVLKAAGRLEEADAAFAQALARLDSDGDSLSSAHVRINVAELRMEQGDPSEALRLATLALETVGVSSDRRAEVAGRRIRARAHRELGALDESVREARLALDRIEQFRSRGGSTRERSRLFGARLDHYSFLIDTLMELHARSPNDGHGVLAFAAAERTKARTLLDQLAEAAGDVLANATESERAEWESRSRDIRTLDYRLDELRLEFAPEQQLREVEGKLRGLLDQQDELAEILASRDGRRAAAQPADVATLQRQLDPTTVVLAYAFGEDALHGWAISRTEVIARTLGPRVPLEGAARQLHETLAIQDEDLPIGSVSRSLGRTLVAPFESSFAGKSRIVVVPDGDLHSVPFAVLRPSSEAPPLVETYELGYLPAGSVLVAQRSRPRTSEGPSKELLSFSDPVFSHADPRVQPGVCHVPAPVSPAPAPDRLVHSRRPASFASEHLGADLRDVYSGFEASTHTLDGLDLSDYRVVLLSTHGRLRAEHAALNGIVLSTVDSQGCPIEGVLRAQDLGRMELRADVVIVSTCESGLGEAIPGEGLVGLTQAFLRAGARSAIVSLWKVEDEATSELMVRVLRGLLVEGLPPAAALRRAQRELRNSSWSSPQHWAGFVLQGDWEIPDR